MADFDRIPAAGDALVDQCVEIEEDDDDDNAGPNGSEGDEDEVSSDGKYRFNGKYLYVTWSKSKIESTDKFYEKLLTILPGKTRVFGGRELHQDGTPHYHAVLSLMEKTHWRDAVGKLTIEGDTNAIRLEKPKARQNKADILENTQAYCAEDNDTFGERIMSRNKRGRKVASPIIGSANTEQVFEVVVQVFRDFIAKLVAQQGIEVLEFARDGVQLVNVEQLREWSENGLSGMLDSAGRSEPTGGRGRGGRTRGGRTRGKRPRDGGPAGGLTSMEG